MDIHSTALVSTKAKIGKNFKIGAFSIVYDNVDIGDNVEIGPYCEIGVSNHLSMGKNLVIGNNSVIRSHSVFYEGSEFKDSLVTGHRVTVRELTFAGENLQIGTLCDLQGHTTIGDYVRLHSNVHVGQDSKIGNFVWIFPYTVLTNDPTPPSDNLIGVRVNDFAVIATMCVILPDTHIAEGCLIGAHSSIKGKTEPHTIYVGSPAQSRGPTSKIKLSNGQSAYPWTKHFKRGYPESITKSW